MEHQVGHGEPVVTTQPTKIALGLIHQRQRRTVNTARKKETFRLYTGSSRYAQASCVGSKELIGAASTNPMIGIARAGWLLVADAESNFSCANTM
jgi:hypothetical protein